MALGFKIADGYVEVHADYDKGEVRRAAQQAADTSDGAFTAERVRNSRSAAVRTANRRIGEQASADFIQGMREQIDRQKETPFIRLENIRKDFTRLGRIVGADFSRSAAEEIGRSTEQNQSRFRGAGVRIARGVRDGLIGRDGAGSAGAAFVTRFVEAVTLGMADLRASRIGGPLGRSFAIVGTTAGLAFATFLIAKAAQYITAATPLLLGALAIIPIKFLAKTDKEVKAAVKRLKVSWKDFLTDVSRPIKPGVLKAIDNIRRGLVDLKRPVGEFFKAIGDALPSLSKGGMQALENFFKAIGNDSIRAGLKEWGKQLPGIGTALGKMIDAILKDPETTVATVKSLARDLATLAGAAGTIISGLAGIARAWDDLSLAIDRFEGGNHGGDFSKAFSGIGEGVIQALTQADQKINTWVIGLRTRLSGWLRGAATDAKLSFITGMSSVGADVARVWNAVVLFFQGLPGRIRTALSTLHSTIIIPFQQAHDRARAKVEELVRGVATKLQQLPGRAASAVSGLWASMSRSFTSSATNAGTQARRLVDGYVASARTIGSRAGAAVRPLWSRMSSAFTSSATNAGTQGRRLVDGFISRISPLVGRARSAVSPLWSRMSSAFTTSATNAGTQGRRLVDGFIRAVTPIASRARTTVGRVRGAVTGALSGAGSWLVSAGSNIIRGLARGISSGVSYVRSAAAAAGRAAVAAVKSALGISSPSKVFAQEVGVPSAQGIAVGLRKQFPEEMLDLRKSLPQIRMPEAAMAGAAAGGSGGGSFSPTVNLYMQPGFYSENAAAKRALTKDVFLALEQYRKDFVR